MNSQQVVSNRAIDPTIDTSAPAPVAARIAVMDRAANEPRHPPRSTAFSFVPVGEILAAVAVLGWGALTALMIVSML